MADTKKEHCHFRSTNVQLENKLDMKIEIKITDDTGNVQLYDVSGSLVSPNSIQKEAEKYQQATANKMAIERTAFAQGALWVRSLFLPNNR